MRTGEEEIMKLGVAFYIQRGGVERGGARATMGKVTDRSEAYRQELARSGQGRARRRWRSDGVGWPVGKTRSVVEKQWGHVVMRS